MSYFSSITGFIAALSTALFCLVVAYFYTMNRLFERRLLRCEFLMRGLYAAAEEHILVHGDIIPVHMIADCAAKLAEYRRKITMNTESRWKSAQCLVQLQSFIIVTTDFLVVDTKRPHGDPKKECGDIVRFGLPTYSTEMDHADMLSRAARLLLEQAKSVIVANSDIGDADDVECAKRYPQLALLHLKLMQFKILT